MRNYIFILISGLIVFSCRPKPIDLKVQPAESKLVVFTQVVPDHVMLVTLTKSFSPLSGNTEESLSSLLVSGATVKVTSNNQVYDFYELTPGVYASYSVVSFQAGQVFELTASADGQTITSTSVMLDKVTFSAVTPRVEKFVADTNIFVDYSITDDPSRSNWYLINVYKKQQVGTDFTNYFSNGSNVMSKSILISDKEFNGSYSSTIELENTFHNDSIAVTLSNISEQYFNYLGFRINNGSVLNQLNVEPINYPTNIINGYGFFNTHFPDIHFYDLKDY
jgi:hypothetical protein